MSWGAWAVFGSGSFPAGIDGLVGQRVIVLGELCQRGEGLWRTGSYGMPCKRSNGSTSLAEWQPGRASAEWVAASGKVTAARYPP